MVGPRDLPLGELVQPAAEPLGREAAQRIPPWGRSVSSSRVAPGVRAAMRRAASAISAGFSMSARSGGSETVLLVEDDESLRTLAAATGMPFEDRRRRADMG